MGHDPEWEAQIERRVKQRWQRRLLLLADFTAFIMYCAWLGASWNIDPFFRQLGMVWMVGVGLHTIGQLSTEWLDFAVRRALDQERRSVYRAAVAPYAEKPKRDPYLMLTDDDVFEDPVEFDEREYRKRR